ncbi:galactan 5-O-arabinofuranosyltransferase [Saccharothrix ecbatanensis]|uniref:Galactan 5-O-arabinofuranosyltransferase n=1 Tax=Saccharothrix ecbatanensis TaxID=1105145 RepID=A0A7W9HHG1_9PSEU|nr:hypothetical protein [Saccharothrix ecbatanensis]MBB5802402.1 galactan 5-O-arabinofuranosyltransferase [Saccharothrix ecbatanensis]
MQLTPADPRTTTPDQDTPDQDQATSAPTGVDQATVPDLAPVRRGPRRRALLVAAEIVASVGAAGLMVLHAQGVDVDPLDRIGQVSGLAALQSRFALIAVIATVLVILAARVRWRAYAPVVERIAAATAAGLFSGLVAGAVVVALAGTSYGLHATFGDSGALVAIAQYIEQHGTMEANYPPGFPHILAWTSQLTGQPPEYALKALHIGITALFGPIAYLTWRRLLSPLWALGLGIVPTLPLIDPYKPYTNLMLVVLIPVLLLLLRRLRGITTRTTRQIVLSGIAFGATLGVVFLIYSGWFVWSAPGFIVAALVLCPWRTGWRKALLLVAVTSVVFAVVSARHLYGLLLASSSIKDTYFYWDTWIEPAYIAMWRGDLPGMNPGPWPPPGELGGVGLFTLLAVLGLGFAIAVARQRSAVIMLVSVFVGAWMLRFHFGSKMYAEQAVQLYPRSTAELLYCLLLLTGFAVYYETRRRMAAGPPRTGSRIAGSRSAAIGAFTALFVVLASAGSAIGDRYMPRTDNSPGLLAMNAQMTKQLDGTCSRYAIKFGRGCYAEGDQAYFHLLRELQQAGPKVGELHRG